MFVTKRASYQLVKKQTTRQVNMSCFIQFLVVGMASGGMLESI